MGSGVSPSGSSRGALRATIQRRGAGPSDPVAIAATAAAAQHSAPRAAHLLLMGVLVLTSRLPQYLMTAMLVGAVCVAAIVDVMVRRCYKVAMRVLAAAPGGCSNASSNPAANCRGEKGDAKKRFSRKPVEY
jgi:hypothetical protein